VKVMFKTVILYVKFPVIEFNKIPSCLENDFSLQYVMNNIFFYLGKITSISWESPTKIVATLEIRKNETPGWYLKDLLEKAQRNEIILAKGEKIICRQGRISEIVNLNQILNEDMAVEVEVWIRPTK